MSKKRTSPASNNDEQSNEDSESQRESNAKRAKLDTLSDTTLHDLPIELLQCILVKAVAMEVKGMKLAKSVWKEKADLVINRLRTVCSQWTSILTTNSFRKELHRTLDGTAEETIRLEGLHEVGIDPGSIAVTTMKDEIFLLLQENRVINVYDRNTINIMAEVKDVIQLPRNKVPACMAACDVSNCLYIGLRTKHRFSLSVSRITKEKEHQFKISPNWIKDHRLPICMMSVSANGSLVILSLQYEEGPDIVSIYSANGSLHHEIMLSLIDVEAYMKVMQKSNGNIVLGYVNNQDWGATLLELDTSGSHVRRYQSSFSEESYVNFADVHGRYMIYSAPSRVAELLDSEFNSMGMSSLQQDQGKSLVLYDLHYENERNEFVRIHYDRNAGTKVLTIFRTTED